MSFLSSAVSGKVLNGSGHSSYGVLTDVEISSLFPHWRTQGFQSMRSFLVERVFKSL